MFKDPIHIVFNAAGLKILPRDYVPTGGEFSPGWLDIGGWKASSLCTGPERNRESNDSDHPLKEISMWFLNVY